MKKKAAIADEYIKAINAELKTYITSKELFQNALTFYFSPFGSQIKNSSPANLSSIISLFSFFI
jgi:hypothetical protein